MNKFFSKVIGFSLITAFTAFPVYADVEEEINKSFSVSSGSTLSLNNINGSVEILAGNDNVINVVAVKKAERQEDLERILVKMKESGNDVTIETKYDKDRNSYNNSGSVKYTITVPRDLSQAKVELVNGSLNLDDVEGDVVVDMVNGSVKASGLKGNAEVNSVNGSIKLDYASIEKSVEKIELKAVNGSIKLYVPEGLNADVEAETMHGSLKSDFDLTVEKQLFSGKEMQGVIGDGHTKIILESVNGSIKLMKN